jgi:putative peptidoglycan lipid II flippase
MTSFSSQTFLAGTITNIGSRSLARLLRLLLIVVISFHFGASDESDAYFIAQSIVLLFLFFGESVLNLTFIPVFVEYRRNHGEKQAWPIANTMFTITCASLLMISAGVFLFAPYIAKVLAPGFPHGALSLTTMLIRIISPVPLLAGISAVPAAVFYSYRSFVAPAMTALFYAGGSILFALVLADQLGIMSVPIGSVVGLLFQAFLLVLILKRKTNYFRLSTCLTKGTRQVMSLSGPRLLGFGLTKTNLIVDRVFASGLGMGQVSCLTYAYRIFQIPSAILVTAFAKTLMPVLSEQAASGDKHEIRKLISKAIRFVAIATIPATVILFMFRTPLIESLFQRGAFETTHTHITSTAFLFYSLGLVPFCLNIILLGVFYAFQNAIIPLGITAVNAALNVLLDVIFIRWLGLGGIALATSSIAVLNTIFLLILLHRRLGTLCGYDTVVSLLKILLASGIMMLVVWSIKNSSKGYLQFENQILELGVFLAISLLTYFISCTLLRVSELRRGFTLLRSKLHL